MAIESADQVLGEVVCMHCINPTGKALNPAIIPLSMGK